MTDQTYQYALRRKSTGKIVTSWGATSVYIAHLWRRDFSAHHERYEIVARVITYGEPEVTPYGYPE